MEEINRDSMIVYRSFIDAISEIEDELDQLKAFKQLFAYGFDGETIEGLKGVPKIVFTLIKPQLDANHKRFLNGKKGGKPKQNETKTEPKDNQNETKAEANNNNNVNNNLNVESKLESELVVVEAKTSPIPKTKKTIEERKKVFYDKIATHINDYSKEMLRDFFEYWSEHGEDDHKMRYEKQKSFDVNLRLKKWNSNNFNSKPNGTNNNLSANEKHELAKAGLAERDEKRFNMFSK